MTGPLRSRLGRSAIAAGITLALAATLTAHPATTVATFDWRVPDRLGPDGMIGVTLPVTETTDTMRVLNPEGTFGSAAPAGWPADFDACASQGFFAQYIWTVNGAEVRTSASCGPTRIMFPHEGRYLVGLTVVDTFGGRTTTAQDVNIQDWLIIGMGDSYGSGEGNPNVPAQAQDFLSVDNARLVAEAAENNYQTAVSAMTLAQSKVDAAKAELLAAITDYNSLVAASVAFAQATADLASAQLAVSNANIALTKATAAVVAAAAKVVTECAQIWDPAGCTAAKNALTKAKQAEAAAVAKRNAAVAARDAAAAKVAQLALAVPVEGFDYVIGVASARINLLSARVDQVQADLAAAVQFVSSQLALSKAAVVAFQQKAEGLTSWQDTKVIDNNGIPFRYSQCHQSKMSGQARAALKIEQDDPKTSVTFIHLACTGATITEGILGSYQGVKPSPDGIPAREPQITSAARFSTGREVDALVTSIGGNDIGFAKVIEGCIVLDPCFAQVSSSLGLSDQAIETTCANASSGSLMGASASQVSNAICKQWLAAARVDLPTVGLPVWLDANLAALPGLYGALQSAIHSNWPTLPADRMFLTQYPKVSRDGAGNVCGFDIDPIHNLPGVIQSEYLWAETAAGNRLNQVIGNQATTLGWTPVTGIDEAFAPHGYCAGQTWMVRIEDSLRLQGTKYGIAHPTADGHAAYAVKIAGALRHAFYPQSTDTTLGPSRVDGRQ